MGGQSHPDGGVFLLETGHIIGNLIGLLEQFFHFQRKIGSFRGEHQLFVGPLEQLQAKFLFQFPDGRRNSRLGYVKFFRCLGDAVLTADLLKIAQLM